MKISAGRVDGFIARPDPAVAAMLVYGPDSGLIHERAMLLAKNVVEDLSDPFRVAELTGPTINDNPTCVADEMLAMSFDGGERLVIIRDATESVTAALKIALDAAEKTNSSATVVIHGGNLGAKSELRKLCESRKDAAALPCYPDDEEGRARLARGVIKSAGLTVAADALRTLAGILGDDRLSNRGEIEKLILFAGPNAEITEDDVLSSIGDSGTTSLDETIYAAADREIAKLDRSLDRFWSDGGEPISLMRATQRHFQRLHRVSGLLANGESYESAVRQLRPPIFWKFAKRFQNQSHSWQSSLIEQALLRLTEAELALKTTGTPGQAACGRTLLAIASMRRIQTQ